MSRAKKKLAVFGFERRHEGLAPLATFIRRMASSLAISFVVIAFALLIGVTGYHSLAGFDWVDSLLEASMILGGMGPVNPLPNTPAKLFASAYALFSGLVFIGIMGVILTPIVHRVMHTFHLEKDGG